MTVVVPTVEALTRYAPSPGRSTVRFAVPAGTDSSRLIACWSMVPAWAAMPGTSWPQAGGKL
ncbi:hypothetical protein FB561_0807 [Kribbella amoyensis]|uniref:Uncharacterized protein n=2 Tax=Kribbella amoyensis TaxID=996641 RepID=A0A561BLQ7_9ACTN|nr:hypothetical protein FB561_0807 [Kribbella amoyensis]